MEIKKTTMKVKGKDGWEIIHPETEVEQVVGLYETITSATSSVAEDVESLAGETDAKFQSITRKPISDWAAGKEYGLKDICICDGKIYQCIEANADAEFDKTKWQAIGGGDGLGLWEIVDGNAIIPKDLSALKPEDLDTDESTIRSIVTNVLSEWADTMPVGIEATWPSNSPVPEGWLEENGASLSRAMYPDLFSVIGTTHGAVDDEHFNLPDKRGRFAEGAAVAGEYKEAGLPNITGNLPLLYSTSAYNNGAFSATGVDFRLSGSSGVDGVTSGSFDASRSSSIYGRSTTVQPSSVTVRYIIKAFHTVSNPALMEATAVGQEIANKANRALTNVESNVDFVVESYHDAEGNWYRKYKSGWVEQGGQPRAVNISGTYNFNLPFKPGTNPTIVVTSGNDSDRLMLTGTTETGFSFAGVPSLWSWYACGQGANV